MKKAKKVESKKTVKADTVSTLPAETSAVKIDDEVANKIRVAEDAILKAKLQLVDIVINKETLSRQESEAVKTIKINSMEMMDLIKKAAHQNGIDPDATNGDKWNFDTSSMSFTKVQ